MRQLVLLGLARVQHDTPVPPQVLDYANSASRIHPLHIKRYTVSIHQCIPADALPRPLRTHHDLAFGFVVCTDRLSHASPTASDYTSSTRVTGNSLFHEIFALVVLLAVLLLLRLMVRLSVRPRRISPSCRPGMCVRAQLVTGKRRDIRLLLLLWPRLPLLLLLRGLLPCTILR